MDERSVESIRNFLQREDVQEHIRQNIDRGRAEATVRIGRAASLFGFTDSQLRDYEYRGLLNPSRSKDTTTGQRQYTLDELDKLAIIRELIDAKFSPNDIPSYVDEIWKKISLLNMQQDALARIREYRDDHLHIDERIERADTTLFWRFYALQALRLSVILIAEDIQDTVAGLVLPLHIPLTDALMIETNDLHRFGESLVGWLVPNGTFYTFFDTAPSFEYQSDYRIERLIAEKEDTPKDTTLIVVPRKAKPVKLSTSIVETIRRILAPLYDEVRHGNGQDWHTYFTEGLRDIIYLVNDFNNGRDTILDNLAEMVIRLGGKTVARENRWQFCCILLPNNLSLPMQQRRLVVRAQSKNAPHIVGETMVTPERSVISISLRAFLSGHSIYRGEISVEDATIAHREIEGDIHSAIAVPVEGEDGLAIAVIYVASFEAKAFSENDHRVLRMLGRMVEELLMTYHTRQQVVMKLKNMITQPRVVDTVFEEFASENKFIQDLEDLLTHIQEKMPEKDTEEGKRTVSFISIDIDNQSGLASTYGDRVTRNLSWELGHRTRSQLRVLFTRHTDWRLYHIYADRFYLFLDGSSLKHTRGKAARLQEVLNGEYKVDVLRTSIEQATKPDTMLKLENITVRLGVTCYEYWKLAELLQRYSDTTPIASVRSLIERFLDVALDMGKNLGGNVIISWFPELRGLARWIPTKQEE